MCNLKAMSGATLCMIQASAPQDSTDPVVIPVAAYSKGTNAKTPEETPYSVCSGIGLAISYAKRKGEMQPKVRKRLCRLHRSRKSSTVI
jgi:hypothetical protein